MLGFARNRKAAAKEHMNEFLGMGGYGAFVWPAYAVSAVGVGGLCFFLWRRGETVRARLKAAEERAAQKDKTP